MLIVLIIDLSWYNGAEMKAAQYIIGVITAKLLLFATFSPNEAASGLALLLPDNIEGWIITENDHIYNPETLYDYIDGGAEFYLSYGFNEVLSRRYTKHEQPDIVVDIFDMGTSYNAFGTFSHARETMDSTFGQGSEIAQGQILFWKDRYFVSILTFPETVESEKAIYQLARKIETAIKGVGPLPKILDLLPQKSLVQESIRYFHHYIWLNSYYYVADQNILHIDDKTDALLAKYGEKNERSLFLLVQYQKSEEAAAALGDFVQYYMPEHSGEFVLQIEDGTWTACQMSENFLLIVFNASTKGGAMQLIELALERIRGRGKTG
jgi:hypothetical protein